MNKLFRVFLIIIAASFVAQVLVSSRLSAEPSEKVSVQSKLIDGVGQLKIKAEIRVSKGNQLTFIQKEFSFEPLVGVVSTEGILCWI